VRGETTREERGLQRFVRENTAQTREVLLQLDASDGDVPARASRRSSASRAIRGELGGLLAKFFATDDRTFQERYDYSTANSRRDLELYRVGIGDVLRSGFTRSGYVQVRNVLSTAVPVEA